MGRDRSLDEFVGVGDASAETDADSDPDADAAPGTDAGAASGVDSDPDSGDASPAVGSDADDTSGSDADAAASDDPNDDIAETADTGDVEPPAMTYRWDAGGECAECGRRAEERWIHEGQYVCADCKEW